MTNKLPRLAYFKYYRGIKALDVGDCVAEYQPSLLSNQDLKAAEVSWAYNQVSESETLTLNELNAWKQRIFQFQRDQQATVAPTQGSLFGTLPSSPARVIDPFTLPQRNAEFWRGQFSDVGNAALYFVVDHEVPILLYVGETVKANQRWKGTHDCKRYILSYVSAHRAGELPLRSILGFGPMLQKIAKHDRLLSLS